MILLRKIIILFATLSLYSTAQGAEDLRKAVKRAYWLLGSSIPTESEMASHSANQSAYYNAVRELMSRDQYYDNVLRYHEKVLGIGLPNEYIEELEDFDGKFKKLARVRCLKRDSGKIFCHWSSKIENESSLCLSSAERPVTPFWKPDVVAWVCPNVLSACGSDMSHCFIEYEDEAVARNAEFGKSEIFDTRFSVIFSLAKQAAGLATAVATENYPYTKILEPGVTAVDGAIAHFYKQENHFKLTNLNIPAKVLSEIKKIDFSDTKFKLIFSGHSYEQAGIISTFGFLRRYEKDRTRANQLYERLLCRQFTASLPRVFPADPGNLRETEGCKDCHIGVDGLADFFKAWGEGGELYNGFATPVQEAYLLVDSSTQEKKTGRYLSDLAKIIQENNAFATCTVQNVWKWLVGREFYTDESTLRDKLTTYFAATSYSFNELVYAISTHPVFMEGNRETATVTDPLKPPPLGNISEALFEDTCEEDKTYTFADDVQPLLDSCTRCHDGTSSLSDLTQESAWSGTLGATAVGLMNNGNMPPGSTGKALTGPVAELRKNVKCWRKGL